MPIRHTTTADGLPAWRWGRGGPVFAYGPGLPLARSADAARLAVEHGRRLAARRLTHDLRLRTDARRERGPFRGRVPLFSEALTQAHDELLQAQVELTRRLVRQFAGPAIRELQGELDQRRTDSRRLDVDLSDLLAILRIVRGTLTEGATSATDGLAWIANEIDLDATEAMDRKISRLLTVPLASAAGFDGLVEEWVSQNVSLISSIAETSLSEVEQLVLEAVSGGRPTRDLAADIEARFDVSSSRANLIARDQTAKLASQISREQSQKYGLTQYLWSTSGDAQVRQAHADLDGQVFTYAEGHPTENHPGMKWGCRCVDEPVLPDEDVDTLRAAAIARQEEELRILQASPTVQGEIPNRSGFSDWNRKRIAELRSGSRAAVGL